MSAHPSQQQTVTLLGAGDVGGRWHLYDRPETIYKYVAPVIRQADIAFANFETATWTDNEEIHRGMMYRYKMVHPDADDTQVKIKVPKGDYSPLLAKCGFNVVSVAGSHGMDYGGTAFLDNIKNLRQAGVATAGGGKNIEEARAPAILERKGVRVAFLAYITVMPPGTEATVKSTGMAPMRARTIYEPADAHPGTPYTRVITVPYREDLQALVGDVRKAKTQADVVVLSFHWGVHHMRSLIADYQIDVAHAAIDAGADLILGHHPHMLKGIEVYKGKACFYSLCNFLMAKAQKEAPSLRKVSSREIYKHVIQGPEYGMYAYHPDARMSAVVKSLITKEGVQHVSYLPVWINGQAQPRILSAEEPEFEKTVSYVRDITEDYFKTSFNVEGDEVVVSSS